MTDPFRNPTGLSIASSSDTVPPADPTPSPPVELSAERLHRLALRAFRIGNRGRLSLCEALRVLHETRLYLDLGFSSIAGYADTHFQLRRAEAFEYVRVARALVELSQLREAFGRGRVGWSVLKAITRVASVDTQASWVEFARGNTVESTLAEARDALRRGRDAPRDSTFGLPNLDQKLVLRFSRSDMAKVRGFIESTCAAVAENTGAEEVSPEQAVLFLCERETISDAPSGSRPTAGNNPGPDRGAGADRGAGGRAVSYRAQIVYQHCPDCARARIGTGDGFVEVAAEEVERFAGSAERLVLDGPTPPGLRRRVLARESGRCANPRCHHRADHCHHIVFRSRGGRTDLANEVAVCTTCHALIHAGLLRVSAHASGELRWRPVVAGDSMARTVASEQRVADRLPVLGLVTRSERRSEVAASGRESASADSTVDRASKGGGIAGPGGAPAARTNRGRSTSGPESADADSPRTAPPRDADLVPRHALDLEELATGLTRLGVPAGRSRRIISDVVRTLPRSEITEEGVMKRAIASI